MYIFLCMYIHVYIHMYIYIYTRWRKISAWLCLVTENGIRKHPQPSSLYKISTPSGRMRRKACTVSRKLLESWLGCLAAQYEKSQMQPPVCSFRTFQKARFSAPCFLNSMWILVQMWSTHSIPRSKASLNSRYKIAKTGRNSWHLPQKCPPFPSEYYTAFFSSWCRGPAPDERQFPPSRSSSLSSFGNSSEKSGPRTERDEEKISVDG